MVNKVSFANLTVVMIELTRFQYLIVLAETGNYRRAAEKLGITHSALSQMIAKIERDARAPLFERRKRATVPTAYGETLLQAAREAVALVEDANREISLMRNLESGQLNVGIDPVLSEGLLAPALAILLRQKPSLRFTTASMNWRSMETALSTDRIDLFIGLAPDTESSALEYRSFNLAPPVFACRAKHPILQTHTLTLDDLVHFPFGGGDVPDWLLMQFITAFPNQLKSLQSLREIFLTTTELGLTRQLLQSTDMIALLPQPVVQAELETGRVCLLPGLRGLPDLQISGVVATREDRPISPAAAQLSRIVLEVAGIGWQQHLTSSPR